MTRCKGVADPLQTLPAFGVARTPYYVRGCSVATHSATPAVATPVATLGEQNDAGRSSVLSALSKLRANYAARGKLIEARAIEYAMKIVREMK